MGNAQGRIRYDLSTTPEGATVSCFTSQDAARFWANVDRLAIAPSECWLWTASVNQRTGYGQFGMARGFRRGGMRQLGAHRVAWELTNGPIPADQHVLHSCDTPRCCNPGHLFLGTHRDNMRDAAAKGRLHAPRPTAQRLTDAQVSQIRTLAASGVLHAEIARQYTVSRAFVSLVVRGKRRQYAEAS